MKEPMPPRPVFPARPVALVTGSASLLGSAISRTLAQRGMRVGLHFGKSLGAARRLQGELKAAGFETLLLPGDLRKKGKPAELVRKITDRWGRLDLLVNNASLFKPTEGTASDWREWGDFFTVNAVAPFVLAAAAKPWLKSSRGCVVNITDIYGEMPVLSGYPAYCASKAALIALTRYLAAEFAPEIRVNAVSPGVISFPEKYGGDKRRKLVRKSLLKRRGEPSDIAGAVYFLARSPFVTGQVLKVDGGRFTA